ncbi:MAG: TIGR03620 family F420-dependent LLM class oxidoreductase [Pseudomonadota bacterium]|nr:TIGR03620 family F420-dependent LLM class oxidoreductase [Pseudomonadota bacterium]
MKNTLGKLGVWSFIDNYSATEAAEFAQKVEAWGYSALWLPEAVGRDPFSIIGYLAGQTTKLVFATGIANIYARDPMATNAARKTLGELAPGRFILGLGVSHAPMVSDLRGHDYKKPVTQMRSYLERMESAFYMGPEAEQQAPILLGALRTNMLKLSAEEAQGTHPYFVTAEHTAKARELIGDKALLCPEQAVLLETDSEKARFAARQHMGTYLSLPNYRNNLLELGFNNDDFENGGSDRLVDAIVAWGDEDTICTRIEEHWQAGADHVCIQALRTDGEMAPDTELLALLAPNQQ